MLEALNTIDTTIFLFLNGLHSAFFDSFMYTFSDKWVWIPFYASLLFVFIRYWKKEALWIILALVLCIVIADQVSSGIIKQLVQRPRPTRAEELEGMVHIVNGYRGGRFGFVSSHAANSFGLALFCSLLFRKKIYTWILFLWAVLTSYSRIYLGVHYPFDILGGIIVGCLSALLCYWLLRKFRPEIPKYKEYSQSCTTTLQKISYTIPLWILGLTTAVIVIYSAITVL